MSGPSGLERRSRKPRREGQDPAQRQAGSRHLCCCITGSSLVLDRKWVIGVWAQHSLELCVWEGRD